MNTTVKASLILVAGVTLLSLAVFALGLHRDYLTGQYAFLFGAIALNVGVVFWALRRDASVKTYGAQLLTALGIGLLAGFLIVVFSWFLMSVVFPDVLDESKEAAVVYLETLDQSAEKREAQLVTIDKATPLSQAIPGFFGTLVTSLLAGAIIAIFQRRKQ